MYWPLSVFGAQSNIYCICMFQIFSFSISGTVGGSTYGVAKKAKIIAVKVLDKKGNGNTAAAIEGIQYVHNETRRREQKEGKKPKVVVNMSLGGKCTSKNVKRMQALEAAIGAAIADGVTIVVAAGNCNMDACQIYSRT